MKKLFLVVVAALMFGCDSEDLGGGAAQLELVTGINLPDANPDAEDMILVLGNPNIRNAELFTMTPNPGQDEITLTSAVTITDVWIVPGKPLRKYKDVDYTTILDTNLYPEAEINDQAILTITEGDSQEVIVDMTEQSTGYYRVFVKIDGQVYWDNIYISNDGTTEVQTLIDFWE